MKNNYHRSVILPFDQIEKSKKMIEMAKNLIVYCAVSALRFLVDVAFQMSNDIVIDNYNHLFILFSRDI